MSITKLMIVPVLGMGLLSGCASIVTGTNQSVSVETPGCPGATCKLSNDKGIWYVSSTPGSVTVHRAYSDLAVVCSKEGYNADGLGSEKSSTKGMAFGNILIGGVIGAGIDVGTGAAYDYPATITVPMECNEHTLIKNEQQLARETQQPLQVAADGDSLPVSGLSCAQIRESMENEEEDAFAQAVWREKWIEKCVTD